MVKLPRRSPFWLREWDSVYRQIGSIVKVDQALVGEEGSGNTIFDRTPNAWNETETGTRWSQIGAQIAPQSKIGRWSIYFTGVAKASYGKSLPNFSYQPFSITTWFKTATMNQLYYMLNYGNVNALYGWGLYTNPLITFELVNSVGGAIAGVTSNKVVADMKWHFVAVTDEGVGGNLRMYVDADNYTVATSGAAQWSAGNMRLYRGSLRPESASTDYAWAGWLDETLHWSKVLTDGEVRQIYTGAIYNKVLPCRLPTYAT